jgi:hypothetical protein
MSECTNNMFTGIFILEKQVTGRGYDGLLRADEEF